MLDEQFHWKHGNPGCMFECIVLFNLNILKEELVSKFL